jgi:SAM-dependent methyltransferase
MSDGDLSGLTPHELQNQASWDADSDAYQVRHGGDLADSGGVAWGTTQIPESELRVLGEVAGKDVLELGCGAAQWSIGLAKLGARPIGIDLSERQLEHARRLQEAAGVSFPVIHASAENVPLPDSTFDIVFCDHGAMTFADPYATVPEVARLLRPGGLFAFSHMTPLAIVCVDVEADAFVPELKRPLFGLHRIDWGGDEPVDFNLPQGGWIRLFRDNGLVVEDLIEVQPPEGATSTYRSEAETQWARRWPMEQIWRLRKT